MDPCLERAAIHMQCKKEGFLHERGEGRTGWRDLRTHDAPGHEGHLQPALPYLGSVHVMQGAILINLGWHNVPGSTVHAYALA